VAACYCQGSSARKLPKRLLPALHGSLLPHCSECAYVLLQSMMKGMDPAQLSEMMRASGLSVTPDQAAKMVDQLDRVSGGGQHFSALLLDRLSMGGVPAMAGGNPLCTAS
jgi:hypothetical protein